MKHFQDHLAKLHAKLGVNLVISRVLGLVICLVTVPLEFNVTV